MNTKSDPYATKLHKRIDMALIILTALPIAVFLRVSAHGEPLVSVAPQPFWSTVRFFQTQPKLSPLPVSQGMNGQSQADYPATVHPADFSALAGFAANSGTDVTRLMIMPAPVRASDVPTALEVANTQRSVASPGPGLADSWSHISGVDSTVPALWTSFSSNSGDATNPESMSHSSEDQVSAEEKISDRALRSETSARNSTPSGSRNLARQNGADRSSSNSAGISIGSAESAARIPRFDSVERKVFHMANAAPNAPAVGNAYTWSTTTTGTAWIRSSNWTGGPANTYPGVELSSSAVGDGDPGDIAQFGALAFSGSALGINFGNGTGNGTTNNGQANGRLALGAISLLNTLTKDFSIGKNDPSAGAADLVLNGATVNSIANVILRNADNNTLTLTDLVGSGSNTPLALVLGNSTDNIINIDASGGITIGSVIKNGAGNHLTLSGSGTGILTLSGANTYSGGTTVNSGTLKLSGSGTLGSTTAPLTVNGGTLDLNGTNQTIGALNGSGGTILNNSGGVGLVIGNGGASGTYDGVIANGTGSLALVVLGGTQTSTGANSYGGASVYGGALLINGNQSAATGYTYVYNTGTLLGGIGTIGGGVTLRSGTNITGATSSTVGTLTMTNDLNFLESSTFLVNLLGSTSDRLVISGALYLGDVFDSISFSGTADGTTTYTLATFASITGVFDNVANLPSGYGLIYNTNSLELSPLTPVPESPAWLTAALALGFLIWNGRRRVPAPPAPVSSPNGQEGFA